MADTPDTHHYTDAKPGGFANKGGFIAKIKGSFNNSAFNQKTMETPAEEAEESFNQAKAEPPAKESVNQAKTEIPTGKPVHQAGTETFSETSVHQARTEMPDETSIHKEKTETPAEKLVNQAGAEATEVEMSAEGEAHVGSKLFAIGAGTPQDMLIAQANKGSVSGTIKIDDKEEEDRLQRAREMQMLQDSLNLNWAYPETLAIYNNLNSFADDELARFDKELEVLYQEKKQLETDITAKKVEQVVARDDLTEKENILTDAQVEKTDAKLADKGANDNFVVTQNNDTAAQDKLTDANKEATTTTNEAKIANNSAVEAGNEAEKTEDNANRDDQDRIISNNGLFERASVKNEDGTTAKLSIWESFKAKAKFWKSSDEEVDAAKEAKINAERIAAEKEAIALKAEEAKLKAAEIKRETEKAKTSAEKTKEATGERLKQATKAEQKAQIGAKGAEERLGKINATLDRLENRYDENGKKIELTEEQRDKLVAFKKHINTDEFKETLSEMSPEEAQKFIRGEIQEAGLSEKLIGNYEKLVARENAAQSQDTPPTATQKVQPDDTITLATLGR